MYLLDTDWVIDYLKGKKVIVEKVREKFELGLNMSIISLAELYEGVYSSDQPLQNEKELEGFLSGVTIINLTKDICKKFGELRNKLRKKGELIGDFDLLIASTALINNLTILSDNIGHYKKIKGLRFETSKNL